MWKYFRYTLIIIMKLVGKIIGVPMFYLLLPFRGYARSRVYNYVLQNDIYLPRLIERNWTLDKDGCFYKPSNLSKKTFTLKLNAYIGHRYVSKAEYYFALCIWIWFDDDSNYDTHDGKPEEETNRKPFGNSFDLGDLRNIYPVFDLKRTFFWITRNTFYNFNYMFEEIREDDKNNFYVKFPKLGWHFGYIPYTNSKRKGRLVYFSEDYNRIDNV